MSGASTDATRVVVRRCAAYLVDVSVVLLALAAVIWVTGDVKAVPNCDDVPSGRAWTRLRDARSSKEERRGVVVVVSRIRRRER